jgi:hypothetical protein
MARNFLKPLRFRFEHPDDVAIYGDSWHVYDEAAIADLPGRQLIALETQIGTPIATVMEGVRVSSSFGDLAATWVALKMADHPKCPPFAEFNVHTMLTDWEAAPEDEVEAGKDSDDPTSPTTDSDDSQTSEVVALPT